MASDERDRDYEYEYDGPGPAAAEHAPTGVEVPHDQLPPETLRQLIESFVHREGTDYGLRESTLERKVADVMRQLDNGEAVIVFDPGDESINVVPAVR
jgi:uncharacterized protein YheU (UPF0270 family)